ncbi:uncharacterized protein GGS22DRAFT_187400 [Annulohypoxylon maeteangense]|uniref:uncharacterized protein n=1 Tax=Annulohypoxylon maeteangense TaxID=1927788 RepID=UPI002008BC65|nr:uncharacterized protein GGS22DRAFT_187400 [Annulohypoxylon maeteangense]KAI0886165.1 hypothetical protein GGS22DRAFT_187400 [Annulohypoxylon maeteangense]
MKASTLVAALAPSAAYAQWWKGAPGCAQSCLSTAWSSPTATVTSGWPAQSSYCNADVGSSIGSCISSACSASSSSTAYSSYSSLSSSLCAAYSSCTSVGSTGVRTVTYSAGPVTWAAPGGWGSKFAGPPGFPGAADGGNATASSDAYRQYWSDWASAFSGSHTWTGGVATVTGCSFDGSPWFVGPGCGWNGLGGFDGWVGWGSGWSWGPTTTETVTFTTTDSVGVTTTGTGLAAVALAVSGTLTTSTTLGSPTATSGSENAATALGRGGVGAEGSVVTGMMGVALGVVLLVAGML